MNTKRAYRRPIVMTKARRLSDLRAILDLCFILMCETYPDEDVDLKELANRTGLSVSTIRRLASHQYGLGVRFSTVQSMGLGAGVAISPSADGIIRMSQIRD